MILVSECLLGIECNYKGSSKPNERVIELFKQYKVVPVCPEQLGGFATPREPAEQRGDKVFTNKGKDVTCQYNRGAQEVLKIAKMLGCKKAILKARSPSCGYGKIYDGTFSETLIDGDGVTAKLLKENGITVYTEEDLQNDKVWEEIKK